MHHFVSSHRTGPAFAYAPVTQSPLRIRGTCFLCTLYKFFLLFQNSLVMCYVISIWVKPLVNLPNRYSLKALWMNLLWDPNCGIWTLTLRQSQKFNSDNLTSPRQKWFIKLRRRDNLACEGWSDILHWIYRHSNACLGS